MVEPTPLTLHRDYSCYLCPFSLPFFHILPSPSPPSMANSEPTTVNTTNGHKTEKKKNSQPKENPTISYICPQKEKISNHQYHHQPHKPTSITAQASNHNYKKQHHCCPLGPRKAMLHFIKLYLLLICLQLLQLFLIKSVSLKKIYLKLQINLSYQIKLIFSKNWIIYTTI